MRRRVASGIILRQDVCLFCAFRPSSNVTTRASYAPQVTRNYHKSAVALRPAHAAAAQRQDEEDDSPMLRQNKDLANSFPVPRKATQSTSNDHQKSTPANKPLFRNKFGQALGKENVGQRSRAQNNGNTGFESRRILPNGNQYQRMDRQPRQSDDRNQSRQRQFTERRFKPSDDPNLTMRHFVPGQVLQDADQEETNRPNMHVSRNGSDQRLTEGLRLDSDNFQQQHKSQKQPKLIRRLNSSDPVSYVPFGGIPAKQQSVSEQKTPYQESKSDNVSTINEGEAGVYQFEAAPVVTSVVSDEPEGFHRRRAPREDKRKLRSTRYEDENEIDVSSSTPSRTPVHQSRGGLRGSDFDYQMAEAEEALYGEGNRRKKKSRQQKAREAQSVKPTINIVEFMSVGQLARALNVQLDLFIERLEEEGFEGARYDHILDAQTSSMLADLYGFDPIIAVEEVARDLVARPIPDDVSMLPPRPPIVTIMGHVDHGKTTILDYLRKSSVVATEHGGITQHIGAFSVTMPGTNRQITFLDTPGHAAFLEMRRRGANVTDIVVLVVAADDSVKPQTIEAIKHAKDANVQIIVAINKVDKQDADIDRVKQDLTRHDIVVEDYGGDFQSIAVSGKTGQGMAELEEAIITLADVYDFRAENDGPAEGTVIESKVIASGRVATVLVRRGTLRPGDFIVAGATWARVRTLRDDTGALVSEASPGTPVQVDGWRGEDPTAGLEVLQARDEEHAKDVVEFRLDQRGNLRTSVDMAAINETRSEEADARAKVLAWESQQAWAKRTYGQRPKDNAGWVEREAGSGPKQVHFIIKADVAGSVEAVVAAVTAIGNSEVVANVIHSGIGPIAESDIKMLATSGETGYAISFNQPIDGSMYQLAEAAGLQILDHNIIYKVTDVVKEKLAEHLPPIVTQKVLGEAEVGQMFEVTIKKNKIKIAGCKVTNGTISRANKIRVSRDGTVIYTGNLNSLKNVKKDVTEMRKGTECGMGFEDWDDFQEGDQIQCFEEREEKRTLY